MALNDLQQPGENGENGLCGPQISFGLFQKPSFLDHPTNALHSLLYVSMHLDLIHVNLPLILQLDANQRR